MALDTSIQTLLAADGALTTALPGGVYTLGDLGRLGIDRDRLGALFTNGLLQPLCVVYPRAELALAGVRDPALALQATRQTVELQFYADGDAGFAALETARGRAFALLHATHAIAGYRLFWTQDQTRRYSAVPNRACYERSEYDAYRVKGT